MAGDGRRASRWRSRWDSDPLVQLTLFRFRAYVREPEALFWTFVFPIALALALGFAFRGQAPDPAPVAVVAGPGADSLARTIRERSRVEVRVAEPAAAEEALRRGEVGVVVRRDEGGLVYRYDPALAESELARKEVALALARAAGFEERLPQREEPVREPGARYIDFLVPGLIALNLIGTGLWGVGYAIVEMRRRKLLVRFVATPMRRSHFLLSFGLARLLFLVFELAAILVAVDLVFDVTVEGSLLLFVLISVVGALTFAGLGALVASRTRTVEGATGLINLVLVPMWILSGVFFSYTHFPELMHPLIQALPLTPVVDALRAVMVEGAGLPEVAPLLAATGGWGVVSFGLAVRLFRWR